MKLLYFFVPLFFSIPLVNGMVNLSAELEQIVEELNVAVDDNYSPDMDEVQLDNHEVQLPSRSWRTKAIIALALLAMLLAFTLHAVYTPKHRARFLREKFVKEFEQKLAKFRKVIKEKELTQAQKGTLEEMEKKVKEFVEADKAKEFVEADKAKEFADIKERILFASDMRNLLMEFFVDGLNDEEREYDEKNREFLDLFEDDFFDFFDLTNYFHRDRYLEKKGYYVWDYYDHDEDWRRRYIVCFLVWRRKDDMYKQKQDDDDDDDDGKDVRLSTGI